MGDVLVSLFKSESLAELVEIFEVSSAEKARSIVDRQEAGVAIIIPERFSASLMEPGMTAEIEFYQDPTLTLGPGIIKSIVNQFLDFTLGTQIGMQIVLEQLAVSGVKIDAAAIQTVLTQLLAGSQDDQVSSALIIRNPEGLKEGNNQQFMRIISLVMGGMMVFFAFYTGAATAGSILNEDENGTLARLFTTPTLHTTILGGKFLSVLLMVGVQVTVLLLFASLIFGVRWGEPASIMLAALGIVACASTFGIFLVSFLKNSRQGGVVFGGILTITGMIGIFTVFTMGNPNAGKFVEPMALIVPQGWVMRSLRMSLDGQTVLDILPFVAVTLGLSVIFFLVGNYRLRKRFA
jgi:ABC-type multidrug transport system permease subunit